MDVMDEKRLIGLLADQDDGQGLGFSMVPLVSTKDTSGPRPLIYDRNTRAVIGKLKSAGMVEERAVVGEVVYYALSERGRQKAERRRPSGRILPQEDGAAAVTMSAPGGFMLTSVVVPAVVAVLTVVLLKVVGL